MRQHRFASAANCPACPPARRRFPQSARIMRRLDVSAAKISASASGTIAVTVATVSCGGFHLRARPAGVKRSQQAARSVIASNGVSMSSISALRRCAASPSRPSSSIRHDRRIERGQGATESARAAERSLSGQRIVAHFGIASMLAQPPECGQFTQPDGGSRTTISKPPSAAVTIAPRTARCVPTAASHNPTAQGTRQRSPPVRPRQRPQNQARQPRSAVCAPQGCAICCIAAPPVKAPAHRASRGRFGGRRGPLHVVVQINQHRAFGRSHRGLLSRSDQGPVTAGRAGIVPCGPSGCAAARRRGAVSGARAQNSLRSNTPSSSHSGAPSPCGSTECCRDRQAVCRDKTPLDLPRIQQPSPHHVQRCARHVIDRFPRRWRAGPRWTSRQFCAPAKSARARASLAASAAMIAVSLRVLAVVQVIRLGRREQDLFDTAARPKIRRPRKAVAPPDGTRQAICAMVLRRSSSAAGPVMDRAKHVNKHDLPVEPCKMIAKKWRYHVRLCRLS